MNKPTITVKQLEESFKHHKVLKLIIEDDECLDRKLMLHKIMHVQDDDKIHEEDENDSEEEENPNSPPDLELNIRYLMLLGILYCHCKPPARV